MNTEVITIQVQKAEVLNVKTHPTIYNGRVGRYVGVLVQDPFLGKIWFKTNAGFAYELKVGRLLSANLTVIDKKNDVTFCKKPTDVSIEEAPIRFYKE